MVAATLDAPVPRTVPAGPLDEDARLAARGHAGDRAALRAIYETHRHAVGRHVLLLTGDPSCVDDLVQDTFLTAFGRLDRFDGSSRLRTFLVGIARNLARNHLAKARRRRRLLDAHRDQRPAVGSFAAAPDETARGRQALARLYAALDRLPAAQREAFVVRVLERRPLDEAAAILGAPVATVSYRARKAETRVRAMLRDEGIES